MNATQSIPKNNSDFHFKNSTKPVFPQEFSDGFFPALKEKIKPLLISSKKEADRITLYKVIFYPALYGIVYLLLIFSGNNAVRLCCCYGVLGLLVTMNVFNLIHDAVHNSLFHKPHKNVLASYLLDIMGGNSYVWRLRHVIYHHTYTNIPNWDIDIQQTGIVRFIPFSPYRLMHRYQWIYMPVLYLFYSLNWVLVRDFKDFFGSTSIIKQTRKIPIAEFLKLFFFKPLYITYTLVIPIAFLKLSWAYILIGFLIMHFLTSTLTLLVLLPSHLDEDATFPLPKANHQMENTWALHQLQVTNDFGTNSKILNFIMGGLNHHIAHHLFPHLNHNLLPKITAHIVALAQEYKLPYHCYTLQAIMISHFKLLKKNGHRNNPLELDI